MKKVVGIFDFDGTITRKDTFINFAIFAVGRAKFAKAFMLSLPWIIGWKLKLTSSSYAKEHLFGNLYKGMPLSRFQKLGEDYASQIDKIARLEIIEQLHKLQQSGAEIIIASASLEDWITPWANKHNITTVIATSAQSFNGTLTGLFSSPNCLGEEKANRVIKHLTSAHQTATKLSDYQIHAFGNLPEDAPILALATYPTVI